MISCTEAVRQLWEFLDHDLDAGAQERMSEHLALCRRCCGEADFAAALRGVLRSVEAPQLPADVEAHMVTFLGTLEQEAR